MIKQLLTITYFAFILFNFSLACETNQWLDSTSTCRPCHHTCASCTDQADNHCITCSSDKTLIDGFCKCINENQYIDKDGVCANCFSSCKTCQGPLFFDCTSCDGVHSQVLMKEEWEKNGTCECSNPQNFAINNADCGTCDTTCFKCLANGKDNCIKCPSDKVKQPWGYDIPGYCVAPCAEKQFRDMTGTDAATQICKTCSSLCSNCSGAETTKCTGCIDGYYLNGKPGHPGECLQKCPNENQYRDSAGTCVACHFSCGACFGPSDNECKFCVTGYYQFMTEEHFICLQSCESGKFRLIQNNSCEVCHQNCQECKGPNNGDCLKCKTGLHKNPYFAEVGECIVEENCGTKEFRDQNDYCSPCHQTCLHCKGPNPSDCIECDYQLSKVPPAKDLTGHCLILCNDTLKYRDPTDGLCKQCHESCQECVGGGDHDCLKCTDKTKVIYPQIEGYFGQCVQPCEANQFWNSTNCVNCDPTCIKCKGLGPELCLGCPVGSVKDPLQEGIAGRCLIENCAVGQFKKQEPDVCGTCDSTCETCRAEGENGCLTCASPKVKVPGYKDALGKCMTNACSSNQFIDIQQNYACTNCFSSCATCLGGQEKECLTCITTDVYQKFPLEADATKPGYCVHLNAASDFSCEPHKVRNMETGKCEECAPSCAECSGVSESKCIKCQEGMVKVPAMEGKEGLCVPQCQSHFYRLNPLDGCHECNSSCLDCEGPGASQCLSCASPLIKQPPTKSVSGPCVQTCESHKYFNVPNNQCADCDSSCSECSGGTSNDCLACVATSIKLPYQLDKPGQCIVGSCATNQYGHLSGESLVCDPCDSSCLTCMGPSGMDCLSCISTEKKMPLDTKCPGKCYVPCTDPKTFKDVFGDNTCKPCFSNCATCIGPQNMDCLTCAVGFNKQNFITDDTMPSNCEGSTWCSEHKYYSGIQCEECDASCKECMGAGPDKCLKCPDQMIKAPWNPFVGGHCVPDCNMNISTEPKYSDPADNFACKPCAASCQACIGPNPEDCLKCKIETQTKYPILEGVAGICTNPCTQTNEYLTDASTTPITCAACHSSCAKCVNAEETSCLECDATHYKSPSDKLKTGKCLGLCTEADPRYRDSSNICQPCHATCGSCIDGNEWGCLTCTGTKVKVPMAQDAPGKCFDACPNTNMFLNESTFACQNCHSSCATCVGGHEQDCLTCSPNLFKNPIMMDQFDLSKPGFCQTFYFCPQKNQYRTITDTVCQTCDASCSECFATGPQNCKICSDPNKKKYPYNQEVPGHCLTPCVLAYQYPDTSNICQNCHETCGECFGPTETDCFNCRDSTKIKYPLSFGIVGKCTDPCPDGNYRDSTDWTLCHECHFTCKTCVGSTEKDCLICKQDYTKMNVNQDMPGMCEVPCPSPSQYKDMATQTCKNCHSTCYTCMGPEARQCIKCPATLIPSEPYETVMKACLEPCVSTTPQYRDVESKVCQNCHSSCSSCFGPEDWQCLSCPVGVIKEPLELNVPCKCKISDSCQPGFFKTTTGACQPCNASCIECVNSSSSDCIKCPYDKMKLPRFTEEPGVCINKCEFNNMYHDVANNYQCKGCHPDCAECSGPGSDQCYVCNPNTEGRIKWPPSDIIPGVCIVNDCVEGNYKLQSGVCEPCPANCKSCTANDPQKCIDCADNYVKYPAKIGYPSECVANPCLQTGAPNPGCISQESSNICIACDTSCTSCLFPGKDGCLTCPTTTVKVPAGDQIPGVCVVGCPAGQYRDFMNFSYQVCKPCHNSCATCEGPEMFDCLTCINLFLNKVSSKMAKGTCDTFGYCPEGQYGNVSTGLCTNCSQQSCKYCVNGGVNDCKYCADGYEKIPPSQDMTGSCVIPCMDAYTFRASTGECAVCHATCKKCSGSTDMDCLICNDTTKMKFPKQEGVPGKCLEPCTEHQFRYEIDSFAACHDCDNSCGNCKGPAPTECLTCPENYTKLPFNPDVIGSCLPQCGATNQFKGTDGACYPCNTKCLSCMGPNSWDCLTCPATTMRLNPDITKNTSCVTACDLGKFWNIQNNSCDPCHNSCKKCMGPKDFECTSCFDHVLYPPQAGTYGTCGFLEKGEYCEPHFFIDSSNSVNPMLCVVCSPLCAECKGPNTNSCTKCYEDSELLITSADGFIGECLKRCDAGLYRSSTGSCEPCDSTCAECKGPNPDNCKFCSQGFIKMPPSYDLLGVCVIPCTDTTTYRDPAGNCATCDAACLTCSGPGPDMCLSCPSPKILNQIKYGAPGNCITNPCTASQFINANNECINCSLECVKCNGPDNYNCLSCATDKVKFPAEIGVSGFCLTACAANFYRDISNFQFQECKPCHSSCLTCQGPEPDQCLTCTAGLYFNGMLEQKGYIPGPCQTEGKCPDGQYRVLTPSESCVACHTSCLKCDGATENDCLACPTYLVKYPPVIGTKGQCLEYCQPGAFRDTASGNCVQCDTSCKECTGSTAEECLKCVQIDTTSEMIKYPKTEGIPGKCIAAGTCGDSQYADPNDSWTCKDCNSSCLTCAGGLGTDCLSCPNQFFKQPLDFGVPGSCISLCPLTNQYKDATNICQNCDPSCLTCFGPGKENCLTCLTTQIKVPPESNKVGQCLQKCTSVHQYRSKVDLECHECHSLCATCVGNTEYDCLTCFANVDYFKFINGTIQCYAWCNEHQYKALTGECKECDPTCSACQDQGPDHCWSCWAGYVKIPSEVSVVGKCYEGCNMGSYRSTDGYCKACHIKCKDCEGPTETDCLACAIASEVKVPSTPKIKGFCIVNTCSTNQYIDTSGTCQNCDSSCITCVGNRVDQCLTCATDKVKYPYSVDLPGKCVGICQPGYYNKDETVCGPCHSSCTTCMNGTEKHCLTCTTPKVLQKDFSGIGPCVDACPDGQYREISSTYKECKPCYFSCATCTGPDAWLCKSCATGYHFNVKDNSEFGTCDINGICGDHEFRNSTDECQQCDPSCKACSVTPTNCTACSYEYKLNLDLGLCLLPCDQALQPSTYRDPTTKDCKACHTTCKACVGPLETDCLICAVATQSKYPQMEGVKGKCFNPCAANQFLNFTDNQCTNCNSLCATCSGGLETDCLSCNANFIKKNIDPKVPSLCVQIICNSTQYLSGDGTCKPCSSKCVTCAGYSESDCLTCSSTMKLLIKDGDFKGQCIIPCSSGQYRNLDGTCKACHANCANCSGPDAWNCLSCISGLHKNPYEMKEGTCDKFGGCPSMNQFRNSLDVCQNCDSSCKECFGSSASQCKVCADDKKIKIPSSFELPGYCGYPCVETQRYRKTDGTCASCHSSCLTCSGPNADQCEVCVDTTVTKYPQLIGYPGKCLTNCSTENQYYDSTGICQNCSSLCFSCMGPGEDKCLKCISGYYKIPTGETPGKCYESCGTQKYRDSYNLTCLDCHTSCAECVGPTDYDCISCNAQHYKEYPEASFVGKCFEQCATTTQFRGYDGQCYDCFENCATCTGPSEDMCLTCITSFYLNPPGAMIGRCESKAMCYTEHQYRDTDNSCKECDTSCVSCFTAGTDKCKACPAGKIKIPFSMEEPGSCLDQCPEGQYNTGSTCVACHADCQTCVGAQVSDCLICSNHSKIKMPPAWDQAGYCAEPCTEGNYANAASSCSPCDSACLSCVGGTSSDCLVCNNSKIKFPADIDKKGVCLEPCTNSNEFPTVTGECKQCFETCLTCVGPLPTDCMSCASPLVKNTATGKPGSCVKGCPSSNQYADNDGVCQYCDTSCLTCKGPGMFNCLTCATGQQKHPPETGKLGMCSTCDLHQFLDTTGTGYCEQCSYKCGTCYAGTDSNCLSCDTVLFRILVTVSTSTYPYQKQCQCRDYYVEEEDSSDSTKQVCNACHYSCQGCSESANQTACNKCEESKGRIFNAETSECKCNELGFFTIADQLQCGICYPTCQKCSNDSRFGCIECYGAIEVAEDGSCGCPSGQYLNSEFLCVAPEKCGTGLVGIVSEANSANTGNICGPKPCPIPYFFNSSTIECKDKCPSSCLTCLDANGTNHCFTCIASYFFTALGTTGSCNSKCPENYYEVPTQINVLKKNTCEYNCPIGFAPVENVTQKCGQCDSICKKCYRPQDAFACTACTDTMALSDSYGTQDVNTKPMPKVTCLQCKSGYYLSVSPTINDSTVITSAPAASTCLIKCLKGQYSDKLERKCVNCKDINCIQCDEKFDYCKLCLTGFDLIEGICQSQSTQETCINKGWFIKGKDLACVEKCGEGYYQNYATHICEKCHESCASCSAGEAENRCLTCAGNRILYKTKSVCVYSCPSASYLSETGTIKVCYDCIKGCGSCTGPAIADCTQCLSSYFQIKKDDKLMDCVTNCFSYNPNTYGDTTSLTCEYCHSKCKSCINGLETGCLSCKNDDIFSKTSATAASGVCKAKTESRTEFTQTTAADLSSSSADDLSQKATEIMAALTETTTTTTTTTDNSGTDTTTTTSKSTTSDTSTKPIVTSTLSKDELIQNAEKKSELITAILTNAKELSAKSTITATEASSLVSAMKSSVQPEIAVTVKTSDGQEIESTAIATSDEASSSTVVRKFEKDQAISICDTLSNIADKIDMKENPEMSKQMFEAASDLLKQTSTLQQDKKVAKGLINSHEDNTDQKGKQQMQEDMEVVKKVVDFCSTMANKIKEKLVAGESMSFNTSEMKMQVNKYSTGNKESLKSAIMSTLSVTTSTTATGSSTNTASTTTDSTATSTTQTTVKADSDPTRNIDPPEIVINEGLIDHMNTVLQAMKAEGKNIDSLTVKQVSYDLDINSLSKNATDSSNNTYTTISDFTRASMLQQFDFELDDGSKVKIEGLDESSQFEIKFDYIPEATASYACVYWDEEKQIYDSTGVTLDPVTKICKAKHMTDFVVQKIKKPDNISFNYGILATVIPIILCIILFSIWFILHKGKKIMTSEVITNTQERFTTVSPFVSIIKAESSPEALNKTAHLACYLITVMMLLVLYFRDSINPEKKFDKLLATGILFALSISIIVKYFLGAIKQLVQSNPWIYLVVALVYFTTCSGLTIWRMNDLDSIQIWNWFHAMYFTFIIDFALLDILIIIGLTKCFGNVKPILYLLKNGGFFAANSNFELLESQRMKAKQGVILDIEKGSRITSQDKNVYSENEKIIVENVVLEGEQFGSRPESKAGFLKQ